MKEFIKNLTYEIKYCMTDEEKEFIDLDDRFYTEYGEEPKQKEIEYIIKSLEKELEKEFIVKRKNVPTTYIRIESI